MERAASCRPTQSLPPPKPWVSYCMDPKPYSSLWRQVRIRYLYQTLGLKSICPPDAGGSLLTTSVLPSLSMPCMLRNSIGPFLRVAAFRILFVWGIVRAKACSENAPKTLAKPFPNKIYKSICAGEPQHKHKIGLFEILRNPSLVQELVRLRKERSLLLGVPRVAFSC